MSSPTEETSPDAPEPTPPPSPPPFEGRTLVSLIPWFGMEPPPGLTEAEAEAVWAAVSAPWHPAVLAGLAELPRVDAVESPHTPESRAVHVVAFGSGERLPSGHRTGVADAGAVLFEEGPGRAGLVQCLVREVGVGAPPTTDDADASAVVDDFLALGTACWWMADLAVVMGHADALDRESLTREVLTGARAWLAGDTPTARNRLRAAFELLTQARERFYPVDAYLVDLCLLDPALPGGSLADALDARTPVTFLASARAVAAQADADPEALIKLREAITEGWVDVVGGAYDEVDEPLLPLESIVWQFRKGSEVYRRHLDDRNVETVARRRFGLYPQLPQLAKRFGFRFAVHLGFDAGRFPVRPESKRLWESPDHTTLETLTRPPVAADRAAPGVGFAWRLARSMKDDHVATVALAHWPGPLAGWYRDLRKVAAYSPVFARSVTLNDFFHLTDRPYETFSPESDAYATPYLAQAVARRDPAPISRRAEHQRLRARLDAAATARAIAEALAPTPGAETTVADALVAAGEAVETGSLDQARDALDRDEPAVAAALAQAIAGTATGGRPGFLVLNPVGVGRRVAVRLPEAAPDLRPEGPLRAAQFTEDGVWAVVDVPAFGFAWVPRDTNFEASPAPVGTLAVRGHVLRNEVMAVEVDTKTGGLRGVQAAGEETPRLGQQLVAVGLRGPDGQPASSRMRADSFEVDYAGPALVQAVTRGALVGPDERPLASFRQQFRLWSGKPALEIEVTLSDLDNGWLAAASDPWSAYVGVRWAWPDPSSMLRRTNLLASEFTEADRPETPDAIDVSTRRQRTALLFGGLAHHQRHGTRMLDTLLIAGRESARTFRLGVALDLEHPFQAAADLVAPAYVVPTESGPPPVGPTGWLFRLDARSVAVTRVEPSTSNEDGRGWGLVFHLVETSGHAVRCRLRSFRTPTWARQIDFQGTVVVDLPTDGDAVLVDLTPHEVARVEVTFT